MDDREQLLEMADRMAETVRMWANARSGEAKARLAADVRIAAARYTARRDTLKQDA